MDITVRDVYNALKQNGFEHIRRDWTRADIEGVITGACVLGQAALNLGVDANTYSGNLVSALNAFEVSTHNKWAFNKEETYGVGDTIINWNDKQDENGLYWVLPTYADVVKMAYAVMRPHFDKPIHLTEKNWVFRRLDGTR